LVWRLSVVVFVWGRGVVRLFGVPSRWIPSASTMVVCHATIIASTGQSELTSREWGLRGGGVDACELPGRCVCDVPRCCGKRQSEKADLKAKFCDTKVAIGLES
jgi:hypothetical protein